MLEKKVDDLIKKEESKYPEFSANFNSLQSNQFKGESDGSDFDESYSSKSKNTIAAGEKPVGPNRSERRFKSKLNKKDD